jgi:hypothetical protein
LNEFAKARNAQERDLQLPYYRSQQADTFHPPKNVAGE